MSNSKYQQIASTPWSNITLLSESVPHLFHWDLCYLWMLEKVVEGKESHVPQDWRRRLEAWEHLLALFFAGELNVERERIQKPLRDFTSVYGIEAVSWLHDRESKKLGVLSPAVIARPLPDEGLSRDGWPEKPDLHSEEVRYFASLVARDISEAPGAFSERLVPIVHSRFLDDTQPNQQPGSSIPSSVSESEMKGRPVQVPMIEHLQWGSPAKNAVKSVNLIVREPGGTGPTFIPRCPEEDKPVLQENGDAPVPVEPGETAIELDCPHCDEGPHAFDLDQFLIWQREEGPTGDPEVIVWQTSPWITDTPDDGFPPEAAVQGTRVQFEWNAAQVAGNRRRRFLELRFAGREVSVKSLNDILYSRLLVPGDASEFAGLPVRHEWLDALKDPNPRIETNLPNERVTYRGLHVEGWPISVDRTFESNRTRIRPELAVGRFPDPAAVPTDWSWYRFFVTGNERRDIHIRTTAEGSRSEYPWIHSFRNGLPRFISIEQTDSASGTAGASYAADTSGSQRRARSQHDVGHDRGDDSVSVGVDFGTTNTLIYAFHGGPGQNEVNLNAAHNGISPSQVYDCIDWLAPETEAAPSTRHAADFLPRPETEEAGTDDYIIPSAVWSYENNYMIRWAEEPPVDHATATTNFKLDRGRSYEAERREYLTELLSLYLPPILHEAYQNVGPGSIGRVEIGFAYPLALGHSERKEMQALLETVKERMEDRSGLRIDIGSVSESMACVRAYGAFNQGRTFLIADMGGGTMDVSLLSIGARAAGHTIHQIGSLRFAGERFLDLLTGDGRRYNSWEIRDAIRTGESQRRYAQDEAIDRLFRAFATVALEFLRTMGLAYRETHPDETFPDVILVGNGWHLIEAFSSEAASVGPRYFNKQYRRFINHMGVDGGLHDGEVEGLPSSKHLVVLGALTNAVSGGNENELAKLGSEVQRPRLPAGRSLKLQDGNGLDVEVRWNDLVGEGAEIGETLRGSQLQQAAINFDLDDFPDMPRIWKERLYDALNVKSSDKLPYPSEAKLRDQIQKGIKPTDAPRIEKGPLQIIIEQGWAERLNAT